MRQLLTACLLVALAACSPPDTATTDEGPASGSMKPAATDVPAGVYRLDRAHASLIFRVSHLGFSNYTARFKRFDAELEFDPAQLEASRVTATVDARSIETDYPDPAALDFNAQLQNEQWLDTAQYPQIEFRSNSIQLTGPNTMRIDGELTLRGVTRPLTLQATFNGGYAGHPMDPHARIGFSARGSLKRSEFGMDFGIPSAEHPLGVGDEVEVLLELEFTGPPLSAQDSSGSTAEA